MSIKEDVKKDFGSDILLSANSIIDRKLVTIPVSPALDIILNGGIPEGSFVIFTGHPKCGKLQRLTDIIYTPYGPTTIGKIKIGDIICHPNGQTSNVIGVYPQGKQDIYEIKFNDGSKTYCGLDHNWTVSRNNRETKYITLTLGEILKEGLTYSDRWKWKIPLTRPVYFKQQKKLIIDPYILGCLIGDGSFTKNTTFSGIDSYIIHKMQQFCKQRGLSFKSKSYKDHSIIGIIDSNTLVKNTVIRDLKKLKLYGHNGHHKFIPKIYKYASTNNRWKLIRGLMDTDGWNFFLS